MNQRGTLAMIDPKALKFTPTHEWVQVEGDLATVGISRFAVDQLTDLILIDLSRTTPGTKITAGKAFGEIESVKAVSDLYAPVSGEVAEVNPAVTKDVQVLAEDPYTKGWLLKVRMSDPSQVGSLLDHDAYERKVADEAH
jgi:glycine cleavage system H protein